MTSPGAFTKTRPEAPAGFFAWEAAGLGWLAQAGSGPQVVPVLAHDRTSITLERLHRARATRGAARAFGAALARLHAAGADGHGAPPPGWSGPCGWIGRQELALAPASAPMSWGRMYAGLRLRPYLRAARDLGRFDARQVALVERVCARLEDGEWDDDRPPSRIHGDLWGGNVVYAACPGGGAGEEPRAVLIDPAAHGGHGETDLAMLALFGTEHLGDVEDAYAVEAGLDPGWRERTGLHQLHPVLVHAVSHGPAYAAHAVGLARRYA